MSSISAPCLCNVERLPEAMRCGRLDAGVATTPKNVTYSSGFWAMSQWIRRGPQAYVLVPAPDRGASAVVASSGLIDLAADGEVFIRDVRRFGGFVINRASDVVLDPRAARMESFMLTSTTLQEF